jgi:hypothetical protein
MQNPKPKQTEDQHPMWKALQMLKEFQTTPEEERILDEFDEFQRQQRRDPINFSSRIEADEEEEEPSDS